MCRYAYHIYKGHFACFACRKVFRHAEHGDLKQSLPADQKLVVPCPECRAPMFDIGKDFKAPKQNNIRQWRKVDRLAARGVSFHSCGCGGSGPAPKRLSEVDSFFREREEERQRRLQQEKTRQMREDRRTLEAFFKRTLVRPSL